MNVTICWRSLCRWFCRQRTSACRTRPSPVRAGTPSVLVVHVANPSSPAFPVYLATGQEFTGQTEGVCVGTKTSDTVFSSKLRTLCGKHCVRTLVGKHSSSNTELGTGYTAMLCALRDLLFSLRSQLPPKACFQKQIHVKAEKKNTRNEKYGGNTRLIKQSKNYNPLF